jgi:hypothetical protein
MNHLSGAMRLIAGVELVNLRVRVVDHLTPLHGKVDSQTISFVRRMFADLQEWYREWHAIHRQKLDEEIPTLSHATPRSATQTVHN